MMNIRKITVNGLKKKYEEGEFSVVENNISIIATEIIIAI